MFSCGPGVVIRSCSGLQGEQRAVSGPTGGLGPESGRGRHDDPVGSWSLGESSAGAVASEAGLSKKALERRTRRTHYGRPFNNPGVTVCCLSRSPLGFTCV